MRQLLLLILLFFAGRWLVRTMRAAEAAKAPGAKGGARPAEARSLAEPVVRCAVCGVHAPKSESLFVEGRYFCSSEHARRHGARTTASER
jgi:uncharacterized protein